MQCKNKQCAAELPEGAIFCPMCGRKQELERKPRRRGNGQGTVYKRGDVWYAQHTRYAYISDEDGKTRKVRRYVTKGGFQKKKDALDYLPRLLNNKARKTPKLIDLWDQYEENSLPRLSPSKQTAYKIARSRLDDIIGREIDTLTTADLQSVVNKHAKSYYPARDMKVLLSHLYKIAMADQFVPSNLSAYIILPALEEKGAEPFTAAEVDAMWKAFAGGDTFVGYLLVMIYSGMMPGELFACRKDMIDYARCEIWGCGKKTKKRKEVPIVFAECVGPVLEALSDAAPGDLIQPDTKNDWYDKYHEATARIGVRDLPPYSCRHTTGTEAAKLNLNAPTIQKIMRHAKISTSQRYIHLGEQEAHSGINAIPKAQER